MGSQLPLAQLGQETEGIGPGELAQSRPFQVPVGKLGKQVARPAGFA